VEGVPLGLLDSREYQEVSFQTQPGDVIVLYSDDITDHEDAEGAEYGRSRLANFVRVNCWRAPEDLIQGIFDDVDRFATQAFDDPDPVRHEGALRQILPLRAVPQSSRAATKHQPA